LVPLPPRAPELNGQENIWQFMRQNWLSNRIFKSFGDIVDHCCYAWNTLIDQTLEDYVHRATRLGSSRSLNLRIGISHYSPVLIAPLAIFSSRRRIQKKIPATAPTTPAYRRHHMDLALAVTMNLCARTPS